VLVVGGGQLGLELISLMAQRTFERHDPTGRLRIHLVDRLADQGVQLLNERYSRLEDAAEVTPLTVDVTSPAFDHVVEHHGLTDVDVAFVCFDDDALSVTTTLNLLSQAGGRFPVVARVSHRSAGLASLLQGTKTEYADAATFRPLSLAQACRADVVLGGVRGQLARAIHEEYRRGTSGGPYDVPWDELTAEGRRRNTAHASGVVSQLEAVGLRLAPRIDWGKPPLELTTEELEAMAEVEHERWSAERRGQGWSYGPVRDEMALEHPDLVPWRDLPRDRQDINRRLISERPRMLADIGIEIHRVSG
jgi:hypothetical protein